MNNLYISQKKILELIRREIMLYPIKTNMHIFYESLVPAIEVIEKNLADSVYLFRDIFFYEIELLEELYWLKETRNFVLTEIKFIDRIPFEYIKKNILQKIEA